MKKCFALFVVLSLLTSCSGKKESRSSPLDFLSSVSSTDLREETGGPVTLGLSDAEIIEKRGEPVLRGTMHNGEYVLKYKDYQYNLVDGELAIYTFEPGTETARHVKIGDGEEQVNQAYGEHSYKRMDGKLNLLGYMDKENEKVIEFVMSGRKVQMIMVADFGLFASR